MEVLFLAHRIPYPPDRGDKIRSFHILKRLATLGKVHLGCFADDAANAAHLPSLRRAIGAGLGETYVEVRRGNRVRRGVEGLRRGLPLSVTAFASRRMQAFASTLLASRSVACVFAFSGQMAQFVPAGSSSRFVMDFVDVDSAKFDDYAQAGGMLAPLYRREARRLRAFEQAVAARASTSLFVSEAEARLFALHAGGSAGVLRNGVDLDYFDPQAAYAPIPLAGEGPVMLFTGQMDYRPNVEAVTRFVRTALPAIRAGRHNARFVIAGRNPSAAVRRLHGDGVTVTGAVDDMRSWLAAADVVVAPLGIARGVQNKVLEAMAMARPVVASPAALEGIDAEPGRDLLVADDPAGAVLALLDDRARAATIGGNARRQVEARYRWDACLAPLAEIVGLPQRAAA
jgi:sugar transferase (PEP-CTERM/EpsH1 system associated)